MIALSIGCKANRAEADSRLLGDGDVDNELRKDTLRILIDQKKRNETEYSMVEPDSDFSFWSIDCSLKRSKQ